MPCPVSGPRNTMINKKWLHHPRTYGYNILLYIVNTALDSSEYTSVNKTNKLTSLIPRKTTNK